MYHQSNGEPAGIWTQDHRLKVECFRPLSYGSINLIFSVLRRALFVLPCAPARLSIMCDTKGFRSFGVLCFRFIINLSSDYSYTLNWFVINVNSYFGGRYVNRTHYFRAMDLQSNPLPSGPPTNSIFNCTTCGLEPRLPVGKWGPPHERNRTVYQPLFTVHVKIEFVYLSDFSAYASITEAAHSSLFKVVTRSLVPLIHCLTSSL